MNIQLTLVKIGKLAFPAAISLGGIYLILQSFYLPDKSNQLPMLVIGVLCIIIGTVSYHVIGEKIAKAIESAGRSGVKTAKLNLLTAEKKKETEIIKGANKRLEMTVDDEKRRKKWQDRILKKAFDSF